MKKEKIFKSKKSVMPDKPITLRVSLNKNKPEPIYDDLTALPNIYLNGWCKEFYFIP